METAKLIYKYHTIDLSKHELYILRALVLEMYEGVCIDHEEFETIHGVNQEEAASLKKKILSIHFP